jgi:hypothetical protein
MPPKRCMKPWIAYRNRRLRIRRLARCCGRKTDIVWVVLIRRLCTCILLLPALVLAQFSFTPEILGPPQSITLLIEATGASTGSVTITGVDTLQPRNPFTTVWGTERTTGFFPQTHAYSGRDRNYVVTVTADHGGMARILVRFAQPQTRSVALPSDVSVTLPRSKQPLATRLYGVPTQLEPIGDADLTIPRSVVEHVLSAAAAIQKELRTGISSSRTVYSSSRCTRIRHSRVCTLCGLQRQ